MQATAKRIANSPLFTNFIIGLIILSAIVIGLETSKVVTARYSAVLE